MQNFIKELRKIEKTFFAEIKNQDYKYDENSYFISIRNGVLEQRIECFDENDDVVIVTQEIDQYNGELTALGTHYQY
nr:MAG TPA: hypothetical protein [Caudoviricetes sp.]